MYKHPLLLKSLGAATLVVAVLLLDGCALFASRPVQEMSDTATAIRAAREVQADVLAPELFRQANEWFFKAKRDYKFKDFNSAREHAERARSFAERAEFESLRNGASRADGGSPADAFAPLPPVTAPSKEAVPVSENQSRDPYPYPNPEPKPASENPEMGTSPIPPAVPPTAPPPSAPSSPPPVPGV